MGFYSEDFTVDDFADEIVDNVKRYGISFLEPSGINMPPSLEMKRAIKAWDWDRLMALVIARLTHEINEHRTEED